MKRSLGVVAALCLASPAVADVPQRDVMIPVTNLAPAPRTPEGLVPYKTIFLNRCVGGCPLTPSQIDDSRTNKSTLVGANTRLSAFSGTDAQWQQIVDCVKDTFAITGAVITDQDPGSAPHFEIMVAGFSSELQNNRIGANVYGVSPYPCGASNGYIDEALVFAFANQFYANPGAFGTNSNEEEICATAAQEISHAFTLDHVALNSDPMTYYLYVGRRYFNNGQTQCGSDCVGGQGPFGQTCTGQYHACACTGAQTQDEVATLQGLFGAGPGTPPTVNITTPKTGDSVQQGFPIAAEVMDNGPNGAKSVELRIDGALLATLNRGPFAFNAPMTLGGGTHTVEITAYDFQGTPGKAQVEVNIGPPCKSASDCMPSTDVCVGGRCVAGPSVAGGLGTTCTGNSDCASGQCASDGTKMYCAESCMKGQCPSGFGCEPTNGTEGVCWPGYDDGSGGGGCAVAPGGAIGSGLMFAALVFGRRRRRR